MVILVKIAPFVCACTDFKDFDRTPRGYIFMGTSCTIRCHQGKIHNPARAAPGSADSKRVTIPGIRDKAKKHHQNTSTSLWGFKPKPGGIRIINFRVTTRLQSKSNHCIWHTTLVIWLRTRPGSSNSNKFHFDEYYILLHSRTGTNAGTYCSLWRVTIQNLFVWGFFKFVWWQAINSIFTTGITVPKWY